MKAIIIGATSGIGRELAKQMSIDGYIVGVTGRRSNLLDSLAAELSGECVKSPMDLTDVKKSVEVLQELLCEMEDVDIVVIVSGTGSVDLDFPLSEELETVAVNVTGFTAIANVAYHYFTKRKAGHIVGVSSVAAVRGGPMAAYNASKAYISVYLEGLSCRCDVQNNNISVTDIRPGFVGTAMSKGEGIFWEAPVDKAVRQMLIAIKKKRKVAYITKRWRLVAVLISSLPFRMYRRIIR